MNELLEKLSSYNLFNYLVPGVVFSVLAEYITSYKLIHDEIVIAVFIFYFVGLVVSRFGSVVLEPILKKIGFVQFAEYKDYIKTSESDDELKTLSEVNNSYRTYSAAFVLLLFFKMYEFLSLQFFWLSNLGPYMLITFVLAMFLFAYRKQTKYIFRRIKKT
ncbi:MAG: hypothetical protein ACLFU1_03780 [Alphaproteobacteria bacterium]